MAEGQRAPWPYWPVSSTQQMPGETGLDLKGFARDQLRSRAGLWHHCFWEHLFPGGGCQGSAREGVIPGAHCPPLRTQGRGLCWGSHLRRDPQVFQGQMYPRPPVLFLWRARHLSAGGSFLTCPRRVSETCCLRPAGRCGGCRGWRPSQSRAHQARRRCWLLVTPLVAGPQSRTLFPRRSLHLC